MNHITSDVGNNTNRVYEGKPKNNERVEIVSLSPETNRLALGLSCMEDDRKSPFQNHSIHIGCLCVDVYLSHFLCVKHSESSETAIFANVFVHQRVLGHRARPTVVGPVVIIGRTIFKINTPPPRTTATYFFHSRKLHKAGDGFQLVSSFFANRNLITERTSHAAKLSISTYILTRHGEKTGETQTVRYTSLTRTERKYVLTPRQRL